MNEGMIDGICPKCRSDEVYFKTYLRYKQLFICLNCGYTVTYALNTERRKTWIRKNRNWHRAGKRKSKNDA